MTLKKPSIYALAFALASTPILQTQNAYAQNSQINVHETHCIQKSPKDIYSFSTLSVYLSSCMYAFNRTRSPAIAWNAAWGQLQMAAHYHYFKKPFPSNYNYIREATLLTNKLRASQYYNVTPLDEAIERITANHRQYQPLNSASGTDTSTEAKCVYGVTDDEASFRNWFSQCATAYNQNQNPYLAQLYGTALAMNANILYERGNPGEAKKYFETSKRFEAYADSMGWSTPPFKEIVGMVQRKLDPNSPNNPAVAQQESQKSGLTAAQKGAFAVGALVLFGLLFGGSSGSENTSSGQYGDPGEFQREREQNEARARNERRHEPQEQRSYGLHGDCPGPGMGYRC
ncbi:MAG: hypothetical protein JNL76_02490 [Alphaproteobacteria bacterium]|nr:hypothetical protein [Alphaproteobacteria bacterium]